MSKRSIAIWFALIPVPAITCYFVSKWLGGQFFLELASSGCCALSVVLWLVMACNGVRKRDLTILVLSGFLTASVAELLISHMIPMQLKILFPSIAFLSFAFFGLWLGSRAVEVRKRDSFLQFARVSFVASFLGAISISNMESPWLVQHRPHLLLAYLIIDMIVSGIKPASKSNGVGP